MSCFKNPSSSVSFGLFNAGRVSLEGAAERFHLPVSPAAWWQSKASEAAPPADGFGLTVGWNVVLELHVLWFQKGSKASPETVTCKVPVTTQCWERRQDIWAKREVGEESIRNKEDNFEGRKEDWETLREAWAHFFLEPRLNGSVWVPGSFGHVSEAKPASFHLNSLTLLGVIVYHRYVAVCDCAWLCVTVRGFMWLCMAVRGWACCVVWVQCDTRQSTRKEFLRC